MTDHQPIEPADHEPERTPYEATDHEPERTPDEATDHEPGEPPSASGSQRRRVSVAGAVIGLLVGLLAFALVVQLKSNAGDPQLENARQDDLVRILSDLNAREQRLRTEISTLQETLSQLGAGAQGREAALAEARRRADELGILAGTLPARGQGLTIRLVAKGRPIHAATVLEAVEELRGAGAEAMQISGGAGWVRIVASTYFVDKGTGIVVDGVAMSGDYTIAVIGPAATMRTALTIPGGVADAVARDGGTVVVDEPGEVNVDALHAAENLAYARPVD
ncbi:MAG TPA: DUF881 domain-containing protein [Micromonosporaceae bacterium]